MQAVAASANARFSKDLISKKIWRVIEADIRN